MKLGEILVYSYICIFYFLFFKGFIIENFNPSGKIPLVRTFLCISLKGEFMKGQLIFYNLVEILS
jgi:hypothetical protein